jgi:hypothetical protein
MGLQAIPEPTLMIAKSGRRLSMLVMMRLLAGFGHWLNPG